MGHALLAHALLLLLVGDLVRDIVLTLGMPGLVRQERLAYLVVWLVPCCPRYRDVLVPAPGQGAGAVTSLFSLGVAGSVPAATVGLYCRFVSAAPLYMTLRYLGGMVVVWTLGHLGYTAVQHYRGEQRLADARGQLSLASADDIARHLHNEIGHLLTYISLEASVHWESDDPVKLREALERVQETTEDASACCVNEWP